MIIRAVAFDIDGTLYPNSAMYLRSLPFALTHMRWLWHFGKIRKQIRQMRPIHDFRATQAQMLAQSIGTDITEAEAFIRNKMYGTWERSLATVPLYDGVRECVQALKAESLPVAVASDFPVTTKLELLQLQGLWDCEVSTEDTGYLKPNPEPFQKLVQCLDTAPEHLLYVGNSYHYDIEGAKAAGLIAAHITHKRVPGTIADFSFTDYAELTSWIRANTE